MGAINTFDATGGTDYVNVSTADAGVTINGGGGSQIVVGSSFADTISTGSGNDSINAGAGNDTITGGDGADSMDGGDGDDTFNIAGLQLGGDTIIGGTGNDTIRNTGAGALSISSFGPSGSGTTATYSSIETLDGNNQAINGSNATNEVVNLSLIGQVLNVTGVSMADGADTVWTAASHSGQVTVYDGGNGTDTINLVLTPLQLGAFSVGDIGSLNTYVAAPTGKTLAPSGGTINIASLQFKAKNFESATANVLDDGQVYNITDCLIPINNVVVMTTASYTDVAGKSSLIVGTAANNTIQAGDGQDLVFGLAGNDSITGGADEDCLFGGAGDDTFFANLSEAEFDDLQGGSGTDTLQRTTNGGQGNLVLNQFLATNGIEQVNLDAGGSNRNIDGNASDNILDFSATTFLSGSVFGQGGNDTITATNSATRTYDGGAGNDVLNGGSVADSLIGGADNDTISGGGGNDTIVGGAGADSLTGGGGSDRFVFNNAAEGIDTITDFDPTATTGDLFNVSSSGFATIGGPGTLAATRFTLGAAATTANHRFIYDSSNGNLWFDSDGTGATAQVQIAQLSTGLALSNTNFNIVA
ncbi:MAG: beta strand repeat-containing protein [Microcystis panniformis]